MRLFLFSMVILLLAAQAGTANKKPYIANRIDNLFVNEDDSLSVDFAGCFADSDGVIIGISLVLPDTIRVVQAGSTFQLKPQHDFFGIVAGQAVAVDDSGDSVIDYFALEVYNVNDPPHFLSRINDTSITNNEVLTIDAGPMVYDIDNTTAELELLIQPIPGIDIRISNRTAAIAPVSFIDTALLLLTVRDPGGLIDTMSFRVYSNQATPAGIPFIIYRSALGEPVNNTMPMFHRPGNDQIFRDVYNISGQRTTVPFKAVLSGIDSSDYFECFNFGDSLTFIRYRPTLNTNDWHYAILDSQFTIQAAYEPAFDDNGGSLAAVGGDKLIVFGRISGYAVLLADIYDLQLGRLRTDTIADNTHAAYPVGLFVKDSAIDYFWADPISSDTIETQLFVKSISLNGSLLSPMKNVLPYIPGPPPYTINFQTYANILPLPQGGYYVLWNFANAEKSGTQYYVQNSPVVYALRLSADLQPAGSYCTVLPDDGSSKRNHILTSAIMGNNIFLAWEHTMAMWDLFNNWRYQLFDSSFTPVTNMADDSLNSGSFCSYRAVNDSILFKNTQYINSNFTDSARGTFLLLTPGITKIRDISEFLPSQNKIPSVLIHGHQLKVTSSGDSYMKIFTLNGKKIIERHFIDNTFVNIEKFARSVIIVNVGTIRQNDKQQHFHTLFIP
jgi:hypothetical protein